MTSAIVDSTRRLVSAAIPRSRTGGLAAMAASELASGLLGFSATVRIARSLGPGPFARLEFAAVMAGWLLVIVRGGIEQVVWREAARRPDRIAILSGLFLALKSALAVAGYLVALLIAATIGGEAGRALAISALVLPASAFCVDVAPRALGAFGPVAIGQASKALGHAVASILVISGPGDLARAAWCLVGSEAIGGLVPTIWQARRFGWPRPRFHRRAWIFLARRGAVASLTRFGRVGLLGADVLVLGWFDSGDLGPYSAARRLLFAAVSVALVIPSVFAPAIAASFAAGPRRASRVVSEARRIAWGVTVPAGLAIGVAANGGLGLVFGRSFGAGDVWLPLLAARLPWLVSTSLGQAALVACRAEGKALAVVGLMILAAIVGLPIAASRGGAAGAGWAILLIEAGGAIGMALALGRLGVVAVDRGTYGLAAIGLAGMAACARWADLRLGVAIVAASAIAGLAVVLKGRRP